MYSLTNSGIEDKVMKCDLNSVEWRYGKHNYYYYYCYYYLLFVHTGTQKDNQ